VTSRYTQRSLRLPPEQPSDVCAEELTGLQKRCPFSELLANAFVLKDRPH